MAVRGGCRRAGRPFRPVGGSAGAAVPGILLALVLCGLAALLAPLAAGAQSLSAQSLSAQSLPALPLSAPSSPTQAGATRLLSAPDGGAAARAEAAADGREEAPAATVALAPYGGPPLPAFVLDAAAGPPVDLARLRGRVVLVHFFATWCAPCQSELPALVRFAGKFRADELAVVLVDVAEPEARLRRFLAERPLPFAVALDGDRAVARAWGVSLLPSSVLLGPDLAARLAAEGEVAWDAPEAAAAVRALLAAPAGSRS